MTTIAYRDGVMASDSCMADDGAIETLSNKIDRLKGGALFGAAGDADIRPILALLKDAKTWRTLPTFNELAAIRIDCTGLLILPNGMIIKVHTCLRPPEHTDDTPGLWRIDRDFSAVGTGSPFAIGAMEIGANARRAVRIACRNDINSRLPVHSVALIQPKRVKKNG